ncbi:MAG: hypothetical protein K2L11_11745 [Muribaculaceae bacterium]|nr:hypothetical protein [Muribaculaceae bacterium]
MSTHGKMMMTAATALIGAESFERHFMEALRRNPECLDLTHGRPLDFGVRRPLGAIPRSRRQLTDEEVIRLMGKEESAIYNFTGMMIEGIAMQEISEWIARCKERKGRFKDYRKYTRPMEQAMGAYLQTIELYWQDRMDVYSYFFDMTLEEFQKERAVYLHLGMDNEICRQLPGTVDREAALELCFTIEMLRKSCDVDREKMAVIAKAAGAPVVRDPDPYVMAMITACKRMQRELGLTVEVTKPIRDVIDTFHNRLRLYCARLLDEEREAREEALQETET